MKKLIAIILSAVVLMSALSACKPGGGESSEATSSTARPEAVEQEPLRVFIDVDVDSNIISPTLRESLNKYEETTLKNGRKLHNSFETVIKNLGGPELELEFPPNDASKREPYISNLRTEILAGKALTSSSAPPAGATGRTRTTPPATAICTRCSTSPKVP